MLPSIKRALALRSVKEAEKKRKDAAEALKKELTGYLAKCLKCEHNGKCSTQEIIQRNLDFAPADGQLHYDIE
jgi:hypothetical protein